MQALRAWMLVAFAALVTGCPNGSSEKPIGADDCAKLDAAIAATEAHGKALIEARTAAVRAALTAPPPATGPCTFALPPATALRRPDGGGTGPDARTAKLHFTLVPEWALLGQPRPSTVSELESRWGRSHLRPTNTVMYDADLESLKGKLAHGTYAVGEDLARLEARLADLATRTWDWELIAVTRQVVAPREVDDEHFESGSIVGRAFLWSYVEGRIRCSGILLAENQDAVQSIRVNRALTLGKNGFLDGDLEEEAFAAAVTGLRDAAAR